MLARPEVKSAEHVLLWLASKPRSKRYIWRYVDKCPCGQYWTENVDAEKPSGWTSHRNDKVWPLHILNLIAQHCRPTFGDLYDAYAKHLGR